jgi:hypothetical protein
VAAFRGSAEHHQRHQTRHIPVACPPVAEKQNVPAPALQQETGESLKDQRINSQNLENMSRVVTVVQYIMTLFNCALSEEDKMVAITKIVLYIMKQNDH